MRSTRSKSPARKASTSRSRSRSRSRGRAKPRSPSRDKAKKSPSAGLSQRKTPAQKKSPSASPSRRSKRLMPTETTPTRQSARLQDKAIEKEIESKEPHVEKVPQKQKSGDKIGCPSVLGGPLGSAMLVLVLPALVLYFILGCNKKSCSPKQLPSLPKDIATYFDKQSMLLVLGWISFQAALALLPVGSAVSGRPLRNGKKLKYRCNGFLAALVTCGAFGALSYSKYPTTFVYTHFLHLAVASFLFSLLLSILLFVRSAKMPASARSPHGNTGNHIHDFFLGRELNPRIKGFDLKFFYALRIGGLGWLLVNLSLVAESCRTQSGQPSPALVLVAASQALYVLDKLFFEASYLNSREITTEGFGYMLAFGDICWVPFVYTLQTRYLLEHNQEWSPAYLTGFALLNLLGFVIYRASNYQKDSFRKDPFAPQHSHLVTVPSSTGRPLIASSWWGLVRHPNYLGDLILALAWSLPCGFESPIPYFYVAYLLALLVHRMHADEDECKRKHGASWDRYCNRVQRRLIPCVY